MNTGVCNQYSGELGVGAMVAMPVVRGAFWETESDTKFVVDTSMYCLYFGTLVFGFVHQNIMCYTSAFYLKATE